MRVLAIVLMLLLSIKSQSQDNYATITSLSKEIARLQFEVDGITIQSGGEKFTFGFSKSNFLTYLNNLSATQSVYKTVNGIDSLLIIDNIPLEKATSLTANKVDNIVIIRLKFTSNLIIVDHYASGQFIKKTRHDYVDFYSFYRDENEFIQKLGYLIHKSREINGYLKKGVADNINNELTEFFKVDTKPVFQLNALVQLNQKYTGIYQS